MIWRQKECKVQKFRLSTSHVKIYQICTLIGSFCWKYMNFQLKSTEELCLMTLKSHTKFEEKLIRCFKNDKNLTQALESLKKLHFDWFPLCKVFNVWPKKVQRSYFWWHWRFMQNLKKNWLGVWKMTWEIWRILIWPLKNVKYLLFNWLLWPNYIMFELTKYRGAVFDGPENWCKIWRKTDLCFQKWHEEFVKFALAEIMNSTFKETFYTRLTESLFLRYK